MKREKIKFAVVGVGRIGKRHIAMIQNNPEAEAVALCDIKTQQECKIETDLPFYASLEEMISQHEIDVLCICTPNYLHANHAKIALNASKHVVIEKPMALNVGDCEEIISLSEAKNRQVFTVMQNRYSPPSQWIKEIVEKQLLGELYMIQIQCFWNRNDGYYQSSDWKGELRKDGGTIFTQFSHFIDMMYWLFGDIKDIHSRFYNFNHETTTEFEDSGNISFDFVSGAAGTFSFSTSTYRQNYKSSMVIIGEKGTVKIGGQYMNEVEYCDIENYDLPELKITVEANDYGDYKGSAANHHFVIDNVVETLLGREEVNTTSLEGLRVVDIITRMYGSTSGINTK